LNFNLLEDILQDLTKIGDVFSILYLTIVYLRDFQSQLPFPGAQNHWSLQWSWVRETPEVT